MLSEQISILNEANNMKQKKRKIYKVSTIRWQLEDYEKLRDHCNALGEKPSSFIKKLVFKRLKIKSGKEVKILNPKLDREAIISINRLGVNINQIAKSLNRNVYPNSENMQYQLKETMEVLLSIKSSMDSKNYKT